MVDCAIHWLNMRSQLRLRLLQDQGTPGWRGRLSGDVEMTSTNEDDQGKSSFELEAPSADAPLRMLRRIAIERTTRDVPPSGIVVRGGI